MRILLLLGSNRGNREDYLSKAEALISEHIGNISEKTGIMETKPCGIEDQRDFLNQIIVVDSSLFPTELLNRVKEIEKKVGRTTSERWGEREIDIDILFYDEIDYDSPWLVIPHHQVRSREFVKRLLKELGSFFE